MFKLKDTGRIYRFIAICIILAGVVLRIAMYLQNRNLILDEANVTRNLHERNFVELLQPLSYEQYAPPVFLWIEKLITLMFGFTEFALRLYPLLCGIAALYVMYALLKKLVTHGLAVVYPLWMLAITHIFVRYSTEVKQYMPDVFITLSLFWLALQWDIKKIQPLRFALLWFVVGSVAIWACMPSVFILAGIGCYYGWQCLKEREFKKIGLIFGVSALWVLQFLFYYLTILKPQANSDYLQNFHQNNFLFATPDNTGEAMHNWEVFSALLKTFGGEAPFVLTINTSLLLIGIGWLLWKQAARGLLLFLPIAGMLVAAALNQYSLLPRVALFSMPILLLLIAAGANALLQINNRIFTVIITLALLYGVGSNISATARKDWKHEQLTEGMSFLKSKGVPGANVMMYHSSGPALKYYTQIRPDREKWDDYKDADILKWSTLYDSLAWQMQYVWKSKTFGFVFTNATVEQRNERIEALQHHLRLKEKYETAKVSAYIFEKQ